MFSVAIGYPAMKGMAVDYHVSWNNGFPWLKAPIKRLIYQVLAMTLFSGAHHFSGLFRLERGQRGT